MATKIKVGVISDTHGLLRPEALNALEGVDHIIHAGDIGSPDVLDALRRIAPLTAIRGNIDRGEWASGLAETAVASLGTVSVFVIHDLHTIDLDPVAAGFAAVVSGHSHIPLKQRHGGVFYLNPGSAGPRRFHLPVSLGYLLIRGDAVSGDLITLVDPAAPRA